MPDGFDLSMLSDMILPMLPIIGGVIVGLYAVARKSWKTEQTLREVHKEVCGTNDHPELGLKSQMNALTDRVSTLETQFGPFLKILEDSLSRLMIGGRPGNPIDTAMLGKIKLGFATVNEIEAFDGALVKEIEEKGPDALGVIVLRSWLALKKAERI
jgi:hypothetical protein